MKLILCMSCHDVFKLDDSNVRQCKCGECAGRYVDELHAEYSGDQAVPIGLDNNSLVDAVRFRQADTTVPFEAFVIGYKCDTMKQVDEVRP